MTTIETIAMILGILWPIAGSLAVAWLFTVRRPTMSDRAATAVAFAAALPPPLLVAWAVHG